MAKVVYSRMLNGPSNAVANRNKSAQVKRKEKITIIIRSTAIRNTITLALESR